MIRRRGDGLVGAPPARRPHVGRIRVSAVRFEDSAEV